MARYLFLCGEGVKRSPTAAAVARRLALARGVQIETEYGGINYVSAEAAPGLRARFDRFVVMERYMADRLAALGIEPERIVCLDIPDRYERGAPELVAMLEERLAALF